jgi:hypothetical protein
VNITAVRAPKEIISFLTAPSKIIHSLQQKMKKKHFLTALWEHVNSLTAQNAEKKLAPIHQMNQFCCAPP